MDEANTDAPVQNVNSVNEFPSDRQCVNSTQTRICLVGQVGLDPATYQAAEKFGIPVVVTETGAEYITDGLWENIFVINDFNGPIYDAIHQSEQRILGPTALQQYAERGTELPSNSRPLYSLAMLGLVICFTGFRKKDELTRLMTLIHNMGGSIRKDVVSKVTHLVANCCGGDKYQYALTFRVPVMAESWVQALWDARNNTAIVASDADIMTSHKLKPFLGARVCFYGFPVEERTHMTDVLAENGGRPVELEDPTCSHVVVDESRVENEPGKTGRALIVKAEWFWVSVQKECCADEKEYLFEDYLDTMLSPGRRASHGTPASSRARKRKRLRDATSRIASSTESPSVHKRRSSVSDAGLLSMSGSYLDQTGGSISALTDEVEAAEKGDTPRKPLSPRQQVFIELVQTETNYVAILQTIMNMFKGSLEEMAEEKDEEPLLNATELKIIFGNLPPIYEIHRQMLDELRSVALFWKEDAPVGKILLKYTSDLVRAYPPFINFFEHTKEMLVRCDSEKPRFHAFLKVCQTRPECGRQSLQELLIRPVQRLPSISLLLNDMLKHTGKSNGDHACLEQALSGVKEVMTHINEDKRKTEGQLAMFDIYHEIDNCPADLLSSHRTFIARSDVVELSDSLSGREHSLVFFLFSDTLEVCKKRSRAFNAMKSPTAAASYKPSGKPFKHVRLLPLPNIKRVIDVRETEDCRGVFALICRSNQELKEKTFSFALCDSDSDKLTFLRTLCRQMANAVCKTDADNFLVSLDAHQLDVNTQDVVTTTLGKAFKFATRSRLKLGRAFSFNKTPSKLMKRAVSTMMGSPFASTTNLTPASQLAQMRLASCSNLNELSGTPKVEGTYVAPMSVQPTRKNKPVAQSLSIAALRRL